MRYTAKFGHLESLPNLEEGEILKRGRKIGRMGNTGKSTGAHLHFDLIEGYHCKIWRLSDIEISREHAIQSAYFVEDEDNELFKTEPEITTYYCDPRYYDKSGKLVLHPGYDIIPENKDPENFDIYWPRSPVGLVLKTGKDSGYGYYALIGFDT